MKSKNPLDFLSCVLVCFCAVIQLVLSVSVCVTDFGDVGVCWGVGWDAGDGGVGGDVGVFGDGGFFVKSVHVFLDCNPISNKFIFFVSVSGVIGGVGWGAGDGGGDDV